MEIDLNQSPDRPPSSSPSEAASGSGSSPSGAEIPIDFTPSASNAGADELPEPEIVVPRETAQLIVEITDLLSLFVAMPLSDSERRLLERDLIPVLAKYNVPNLDKVPEAKLAITLARIAGPRVAAALGWTDSQPQPKEEAPSDHPEPRQERQRQERPVAKANLALFAGPPTERL